MSVPPCPPIADAAHAVRPDELGDRPEVDAGSLDDRQRGGSAGAPPPAPDALRVLVCEDDALVRQAVAELLRALDCSVVEAASATEARELLASRPVDLLLTDLGLPDGDGLALAAWARQLRPLLASNRHRSSKSNGLRNATAPGSAASASPQSLPLAIATARVSAQRTQA